MCVITIRDCGMDIPESHCSSCDMRFYLSWNRSPIYDEPSNCPFCGEKIEEFLEASEVSDE